VSNLSATSTVVIRYANALMDLAADSKAVDKVLKDLGELAKMIDSSSDLAAMISSPMIEKAQQQEAMFALAKKAKFQKLTSNFFGVLVQNGRLSALPVVITAFQNEYAKRQGQVSASTMIDNSVSRKLVRLKNAMSKSGANENTPNKSKSKKISEVS